MSLIINQAYDWWKSTDGTLIDCEALFSKSVLMAPTGPTSSQLKPLLVGPHSLPAKVLGTTEISSLAKSLRYQDNYAAEVAKGYAHAVLENEPVEDFHYCVGDTTAGQIDMRIVKIVLPVKTTGGGQLLMSFSDRLSLH